jgi:hypothetical protein
MTSAAGSHPATVALLREVGEARRPSAQRPSATRASVALAAAQAVEAVPMKRPVAPPMT